MLEALLLVAGLGAPADSTAAYQAVMLRAAPGHLMELIDALQARMPVYAAAGEHRPLLLRHAQGDQWDLLLLVPIGSLAGHFSDARAARWREATVRAGQDEVSFARRLDQWVSWREELYVRGPPVAALDSATAG